MQQETTTTTTTTPASIGAQHFSPWGTSESFICGANAVGRRNSGLDLDRSKTTCRECLEQLDRIEAAAEEVGECEWFALCENGATLTRSHPILGDVPICGRCDSKIERLG